MNGQQGESGRWGWRKTNKNVDFMSTLITGRDARGEGREERDEEKREWKD